MDAFVCLPILLLFLWEDVHDQIRSDFGKNPDHTMDTRNYKTETCSVNQYASLHIWREYLTVPMSAVPVYKHGCRI